jgi:hypothetical protein
MTASKLHIVASATRVRTKLAEPERIIAHDDE